VVLPWHGLGPVGEREACARRLHELTDCLIADLRNARLIDPEALSRHSCVGYRVNGGLPP
jgi:hypothetical protein